MTMIESGVRKNHPCLSSRASSAPSTVAWFMAGGAVDEQGLSMNRRSDPILEESTLYE